MKNKKEYKITWSEMIKDPSKRTSYILQERGKMELIAYLVFAILGIFYVLYATGAFAS